MDYRELYDGAWRGEWFYRCYESEPMRRSAIRLVAGMLRRHGLGGSILDVGCGSGVLLRRIDRDGNTLSGMDVSPYILERARDNLGGRARLFCSDITRRDSLPQGPFDVVIATALLEHIEDDEAALANMRGMLSEGGSLIIEVPSASGRWPGYERFVHHIRRYNRDELFLKLRRAGLAPMSHFQWGFPLGFLYMKYVNRIAENDPRKLLKGKSRAGGLIYTLFRANDPFSFVGGNRLFVLASKEGG